MFSDQYLRKIYDHLSEGRSGEASDLLTELLLEMFNKPTSIDLPPEISTLPPNEAISALSDALRKIAPQGQGNIAFADCDDDLSEADYILIEETNLKIEARQQYYAPDGELLIPSGSSAPFDKLYDQSYGQGIRSPDENFRKNVVLYPTPAPNNLTVGRPDSAVQISIALDEEKCDDFHTEKSNPDDFLIDDDEDFSPPELDYLSREQIDLLDNGDESSNAVWLLENAYFDDDEDDDCLLDDVDVDAPVERSSRAWQVAYALGSQFEWDDTEISLLQEVFVERGWQQAKVAMEFLLRKGMTSEQLFFAKQLKELWVERTDLMIAFYRSSKDLSNYCYLGEQILSWRTAIDIVSRFDGCCGFEEIEFFVDDALDTWYDNRYLRKSYRTFLQYLRSASERKEHLSARLIDLDSDYCEESSIAFGDVPFHELRYQCPDIYYLNSWQPNLWRKAFE